MACVYTDCTTVVSFECGKLLTLHMCHAQRSALLSAQKDAVVLGTTVILELPFVQSI